MLLKYFYFKGEFIMTDMEKGKVISYFLILLFEIFIVLYGIYAFFMFIYLYQTPQGISVEDSIWYSLSVIGLIGVMLSQRK